MATSNKLVVGKGKVYLALFANGSTAGMDERYIGNTPGFSIASAKTSLDHMSSEGGIGVTDASVDVSMKRSAKFQTDNIDTNNVALAFNNSASSITQTAQTGVTETITMKAGFRYQLGVTAATPQGVRKIANVVVKNASVTVAAAGNYTADLTRGSITILTGNTAAIDAVNGVALTITYDLVASTRNVAISANQSLYGSIRFIADNPYGENKDVFMPFVKLSPSGNYELIGDKFQALDFDLEVLLRDSATAQIYVDGQPA